MIPVYINNRDRLTTTRKMVEYLTGVPSCLPIITDNASTYGPLLEWYAKECPCRVVLLGANHGARGAWNGMLNHHDMDITHYVVTDSDLDLTDVPLDVLDVLLNGFGEYPEFDGDPTRKCGLSLRVDDLPDGFKLKQNVINREEYYWARPLDERYYLADIDTTFAMYRVTPYWDGGYGPSLRTAPPYSARHMPWYNVEYNEEEQYFLDHCEPAFTGWTAMIKADMNKDIS